MRSVSHAKFPLNRLFSNSSHIAILHAFQDSRQGMSGRAIARKAGINHQACAVAIKHLEAMGLLERQGSGRNQFVRLNDENRMIKDLVLPLLHGEQLLFKQALQDIVRHFRREALTITLFGSIARGQDVLGSDMDVLFIIPAAVRNGLLQKASEYSDIFVKKFGIRLSPMIYSLTDVRAKARQKNPLIQNILSDGLDLLPKKLKEVLE